MKKQQLFGVSFLLVVIIAIWVSLTHIIQTRTTDSSRHTRSKELTPADTQSSGSSVTPVIIDSNADSVSATHPQPIVADQLLTNAAAGEPEEDFMGATNSSSTLIDTPKQDTITYPDAPEIVRERPVVINTGILPEHITDGQPLTLDLPLFPDKSLTIEIHAMQKAIGNATVYFGKIAGESLQTIALTSANGILLGDIMDMTANRQYKISYDAKSQQHTITEYDPTKMPARKDLPARVPPEGE